MKVKRILHPVGHGAFYTEQFFEKRSGENLLMWYMTAGLSTSQ